MVPLRWGARDYHGAVSGEDGIRQVGDAFRNWHREEEFVLTPKKRPGPSGASAEGRPTLGRRSPPPCSPGRARRTRGAEYRRCRNLPQIVRGSSSGGSASAGHKTTRASLGPRGPGPPQPAIAASAAPQEPASAHRGGSRAGCAAGHWLPPGPHTRHGDLSRLPSSALPPPEETLSQYSCSTPVPGNNFRKCSTSRLTSP
jgi:hypothetical protein